MPIISIDDADDPRIAAYRYIRERDLVGREGRFVAEGKVVLNVLMRERRFAIESLLILENRLAGMGDLLASVPDDVPVHVAAAPVMDAIAGFPMHRGVLAIGLRGDEPKLTDLLAALPSRALVVAAVGIANHDNIGSIFRNAAAFGAAAVILDETCCDPLYRKAIRVSVGATLKVPFARGGNADAIARALGKQDYSLLALSPSGPLDLAEIRPEKRMALFLGTEGEGLPADLMALMRTAHIRMAPGFDSLNVAAASAVALHRLQSFD